jgi:hypothetical protein
VNLVDYDNSRLWRILCPAASWSRTAMSQYAARGGPVQNWRKARRCFHAVSQKGNFAFDSDDLAAGRYDVQVRKDAYWNPAVKGFLTPRESSAVLSIFMGQGGPYTCLPMSASVGAD